VVFSPGTPATPASSTTKTGRHDIVEILLKVELKYQKSNQNHNNANIICVEIILITIDPFTSVSLDDTLSRHTCFLLLKVPLTIDH
jgi:hypothetical protein